MFHSGIILTNSSGIVIDPIESNLGILIAFVSVNSGIKAVRNYTNINGKESFRVLTYSIGISLFQLFESSSVLVYLPVVVTRQTSGEVLLFEVHKQSGQLAPFIALSVGGLSSFVYKSASPPLSYSIFTDISRQIP